MAKEFKLKNPDAPMSFRQGIMIRNLGGGDVREDGLTMQQASDRISELMEARNSGIDVDRKTSRKVDFQSIWDLAIKAGREAGDNVVPTPMIVSGGYAPVMDGACGFAWVQVKPGTSAFAKWLKKNDYARTDTAVGGVCIWISDYNQSMTRKEAHAAAMARVFNENGFDAYSASRMD